MTLIGSLHPKKKNNKIIFGVILIAVIAFAAIGIASTLSNPNENSPFCVSGFTYTIHAGVVNYFACNGLTGHIQFVESSPNVLFSDVMGAMNSRGSVYFQMGTYIATGTMNITKPNILVTGDKNTIIKVGSGSQSSFATAFNLVEVWAMNVTIEGLTLDGNFQNNSNHALDNSCAPCNNNVQSAIVFRDNSSNGKVLNNIIRNIWNAGVWVEAGSTNVTNTEIGSNLFYNFGMSLTSQAGNAVYAFRQFGSTTGENIHDNVIQDYTTGSITAGIYLHFDRNSLVTRNYVIRTKGPVEFGGAGIFIDDFARNETISFNTVRGWSPGISCSCWTSKNLIIDHNQVGNTLNAGAGGFGISVLFGTNSVSENVQITNNIVSYTGQDSIIVQASDVIISGNILYKGGMENGHSARDLGAILLSSTTGMTISNIVITANIFIRTNPWDGLECFGVAADNGGGTIQNVQIYGNDFTSGFEGTTNCYGVAQNLQVSSGLQYGDNQVNVQLTVGQYLPAQASFGFKTAQTGNVASITAYTLVSSLPDYGSGALSGNGIFKIGGDIDVTAFTSGTINLQVTYTDWNNAVQTITIDSVALLADSPGTETTILAKASTSITIKTTGTFTATYNVAGTITYYGAGT